MPKYTVSFKNGAVLTSNDLFSIVFNNPEINSVEINANGLKAKVLISDGSRLIHFKKFSVSSPPKVTYCIGFQKTIRGRNVKTIMEIKPDGTVILHDGKR